MVTSTENNNNIVHGLWIGTEFSCVELLCMHSFLAHGHEFHLWVYNKPQTQLPSAVVLEDAALIIPAEKVFNYSNKDQFGHGKGSYAGFSDIFRYKLLYEKGGWWTDMDVVCLKKLDFFEPYIFRTHHELKAVGNLLKCPSGSELMKRCFEKAIVQVTAENRDWNLPVCILNDTISELNLESSIRSFTNRDSWLYVRRLLLRQVSIPPTWYAIHLVNEEWRRNHINKKALLKGSQLGVLLQYYGLYEKSALNQRLANVFRLLFPRFSSQQVAGLIRRIFRKILVSGKKK
jgi:hypothetical protein